jgi:tetraacyldisaccharide 4'-kinase
MKTLSEAVERAWYHGAVWFWPLLIVLWPLSQLFNWVAVQRRHHLERIQSVLPVPVVVVGNISVGGTGKTPLLCAIAAEFLHRGKRVGVISRGYGGTYDGKPRLVNRNDEPSLVGDEPLLLVRVTGCPVVIGRDRLAAAHFLIEQAPVDIILSDDGLQHYRLPRTVEIAVLDGTRGIGNGFCLPAGPLREPLERLQEVDFVVVNGSTSQTFQSSQLVTHLSPQGWLSVSSGEPVAMETLQKGMRVHAVAGIGNPKRFFDTVRGMGLEVIEHVFPDHHLFTPMDIQFPDHLPVVMTEKDAVKCAGFAPPECFALQVQMQLPAHWVSQLLARIERNFRRVA